MAKHSLPVKWVGDTIRWGQWMADDGFIPHHPTTDSYVCPKCRTQDHPRYISGYVGRKSGLPLIELYLRRCMSCGYTTVTSLEMELGAQPHDYVLSDEDYGDEGTKTVHQGNDDDPAYKTLTVTLRYLQQASFELMKYSNYTDYGKNATDTLAAHIKTAVADCTDIVRKYRNHLERGQNDSRHNAK